MASTLRAQAQGAASADQGLTPRLADWREQLLDARASFKLSCCGRPRPFGYLWVIVVVAWGLPQTTTYRSGDLDTYQSVGRRYSSGLQDRRLLANRDGRPATVWPATLLVTGQHIRGTFVRPAPRFERRSAIHGQSGAGKSLYNRVANDAASSGGNLEPPWRRLDPPSRLRRINHIPVDHERLRFRRLDKLETATADHTQRFACGGGEFTFEFGLGHGIAFL